MSRARRRGFTLLEVLLATSLLALALTLSYGAIRAAVGATRSGEALIDRTESLRVAQEFLRRQISHASPLVFEEQRRDGQRKMFEGDAESMRFVAPMPGYLSRGGAHVQWLTLVREGSGYRLEFDHAQLNGYDPEQPKGEDARDPVVLLEGIAEARFEYRTLDERGEIADWTDVWEDPAQMPLMVRLDLRFEDEAVRRWPTLEVPLRIARAGVGARNITRFDLRPDGRDRQ